MNQPHGPTDAKATVFSERWRPALLAFFLRRVRDRHIAEDLVQDTLVRALGKADIGDQPDAYMFKIAQNLLIDHTRRRQVRDAFVHLAAGDTQRDHDPLHPERILQGREQLARIAEALADLPERTRTMFILYRIENLSQDAVAEAFGISTSAVKQHIAKAMAMLARRMRNGE